MQEVKYTPEKTGTLGNSWITGLCSYIGEAVWYVSDGTGSLIHGLDETSQFIAITTGIGIFELTS